MKKWIGHILLTVLIVANGCTTAGTEAPPSTSPLLPARATPDRSATATFLEARAHFEQVIPGKTIEKEVLALLGVPEEKYEIHGRVELWYNPPRGWIILKDGIVVEMSLLPRSLGEVVNQYGEPDQVMISIFKDEHHGGASTWLLFSQHHLAVGVSGEFYSFSPDLRVGGYKVAPDYFDEFVKAWGLDGNSTPGETKLPIAWPGFAVTPTP